MVRRRGQRRAQLHHYMGGGRIVLLSRRLQLLKTSKPSTAGGSIACALCALCGACRSGRPIYVHHHYIIREGKESNGFTRPPRCEAKQRPIHNRRMQSINFHDLKHPGKLRDIFFYVVPSGSKCGENAATNTHPPQATPLPDIVLR